MSKRKRNPDEIPATLERHAKIRIQELNQDDDAARKAERRLAKIEKRALKKAQKEHAAPQANSEVVPIQIWEVSEPAGGQMLDADPVFSLDEEYILIPFQTSVAVYSTSTSLLLRKLSTKSLICGLALTSDPNQIFITARSGIIQKWNWREGSMLDGWQISSQIHSCTTNNGLLYIIDRKDGGHWLLSAHRLVKGGEKAVTDVKTLLKFRTRLTSFKVLNEGRIIVATSQSQLLIGTCKVPAPTKLNDLNYVWRVVQCPEWIVSFDVRSRPSSKKSPFDAIDVVTGGLKGSIYVYEDLLLNLMQKESGRGEVSSRRLHWHRSGVLSVKWSLDGNYIISGGHETVLVIWQMETGRKQDLPHLGAPIESIVVSPTGTSYSVRLADNSAMILSTAELSPTFSAAGIHIPSEYDARHLPFLPTVDTPHSTQIEKRIHPSCIHQDRILLATPPSKSSSGQSSQPAPYLQTCTTSGHQISRQALARTKITSLNMGPESNTIEDPNVTHMAISGPWLATVEEWSPPLRDFSHLSYDADRSIERQIARREICLKIWSWNEDKQIWELNSRIDRPHLAEASNRILDLASDPTDPTFSTVDENGIVKIWSPSARKRNGLTVKGKTGESLSSWKRRHTTTLGESAPSARLAFSADGSVLAATTCGPIYLIDTSSGRIEAVKSGLASGTVQGLAFIGRYLVILSFHLLILDLIDMNVHTEIDLQQDDSSKNVLSVDHARRTFAVSVPDRSRPGKSRSMLAIFDETIRPLCTRTVPSTILALHPAPTKKGYYVLDTNAEIRSILPKTSFPITPQVPQDNFTGLENTFGPIDREKKLIDVDKDVSMISEGREVDDEPDERVVTREQLAGVFDVGNASALAMPPIERLFESVVLLYRGRRKD